MAEVVQTYVFALASRNNRPVEHETDTMTESVKQAHIHQTPEPHQPSSLNLILSHLLLVSVSYKQERILIFTLLFETDHIPFSTF